MLCSLSVGSFFGIVFTFWDFIGDGMSKVFLIVLVRFEHSNICDFTGKPDGLLENRITIIVSKELLKKMYQLFCRQSHEINDRTFLTALKNSLFLLQTL